MRTAVDPSHFRTVLGRFPTGVTVCTARTPGGPVGFVVGSFFSVSLDPALVGFCAGKESATWARIRAAGAFCVNVLAEDQAALCRSFSDPSGDRFARVEWAPTAAGAPRLARVVAWVDCDLYAVHDAGDHEVCIGRVLDLAQERDAGPLVFHRGGFGRFTS